MSETDDQRKKNPLGPTGQTVAANIKRLREKHGLAFTELSARLAQLGRQIPPLGLRKIETLNRRVDADDLMALAVALGTNPNALLFPPSDFAGHVLRLTAAGDQPAWQVWRWAKGEAPLDYSTVPDTVPTENRGAYARAYFENNSDPKSQDWTSAPNLYIVKADDDGDD
jgi:transcriptional regulator with XRE-family HTH domain